MILQHEAALTVRRMLTRAPLWAFIYGIAILGVAVLGYSLGEVSRGESAYLLEVGLLFALCALAQAMPVPLFRNSSMSVNFAIAIAAMIYLGPAAAVVANLGDGLVMGFRPRPKPLHKVAYNIGQLSLATAAAGLAYTGLGSSIRPAALEWANLWPVIVAIVAYFFVNTGLLAAAISATTASTLSSVWGLNYRWLAPNFFGLGLVGFGMATAVATVGLLGPGIFLIPLTMAWYSFKLYMSRTEEVRRRNEELRLTNAQLDVANARLSQRVTELSALNRIGLSLNGSLDLANVLGEILTSALRLVPAQAAAVALADPASGRLRVANAIGLSGVAAEALQRYDGPVARAYQESRPVVMADTVAAGEGSLANNGVGALLALPLHFGGQMGGVFVVTYASAHDTTEDQMLLLSTLAQQASTAVHNARLYQKIEQSYLSTIQAMVTVVDARERYAPGHAERIRDLALTAAREMGYEAQEQDALEMAALFHDIGHIGVPETVLSKAGDLTGEEWEMVRRHPILGVSTLNQVPRMEAVVPIILQHHERYDGQGYPHGTLGEDIHPLAQILAVADAYKAMTSARPHRRALTATRRWSACARARAASSRQKSSRDSSARPEPHPSAPHPPSPLSPGRSAAADLRAAPRTRARTRQFARAAIASGPRRLTARGAMSSVAAASTIIARESPPRSATTP